MNTQKNIIRSDHILCVHGFTGQFFNDQGKRMSLARTLCQKCAMDRPSHEPSPCHVCRASHHIRTLNAVMNGTYCKAQYRTPFAPHQNHTNTVVVFTNPEQDTHHGFADAVVTSITNQPIGIATADCAPVLLWDPCGVVGAAHAGVKGAISGVLENTIQSMLALGAHRHTIRAVIGPTIQQNSYPVQQDFLDTIQRHSCFDIAPFIKKGCFFNVPAYVHHRLHQCIDHVHDTKQNTYGTHFFSHRYAMLSTGKSTSQRNFSWIMHTS